MLYLLPATMLAEFDKCARPNGEWAGFDQGIGSSRGRAVVHSGTHVYVGGYAAGALSFATSHSNGDYHDHLGTRATHDAHTDVTVHHETDSVAATGGSSNTNILSSQLGQDSFIYKIMSDDSDGTMNGKPISVYAMDTNAYDGNLNGTGVNGRYGGWSYISGLDSFDLSGDADKVAVSGMVRGRLSLPKADGTTMELTNQKDGSYSSFVAKVDMATNGVIWATKSGLFNSDESDRKEWKDEDGANKDYSAYPISVGTTAAGHVIARTYTYWRDANRNRIYQGALSKFNGANGTPVWSKDFGTEFYERSGKISVAGETVFMSGKFKGKDSTAFAPLTATSCEDGEGDSVAVAAYDVSPSDAPVASWVTVIGCGGGSEGSFVEGEFLYVVGSLDEGVATILPHAATSTAAKCTMTGNLKGFLVKLNKADGKCVWAKDMSSSDRVVANADYVWTMYGDNDPYAFDATHSVTPSGTDVIMGKFQAADGVGMWGAATGGAGRDYAYDMAMTPTGPVTVGYSDTQTVTVGDVTVNNLQHQAAEAEVGATDGDRAGLSGMFVIQVSTTDKIPSCISACPDLDLTATSTTIAAGNCYADAVCIAEGAFSPSRPCFQCESATSQIALTGPVTENHCFINDLCVATGSSAPTYARYGKNSVCEVCDPVKDFSDWSLETGYFHDRNFAGERSSGASDYGLYFVGRSNGCQVLPAMVMPTSSSADLISALATPTSAAVADIGARATSAISATNGASSSNQGAEIAWAWYLGDATTCTKETAAADVCMYTPSALSDTMAAAFETNLYYGHSVARVKVQQGLAILQSDLVTASTDRTISDLKVDIMAHILIPYYQGAILSAYHMDVGPDKATAQTDGAAYWSVINQAIGDAFAASDRATLTAMFASTASGSLHFCTVQALLLRNLPSDTNLQYGSNPFKVGGDQGCTEGCNALTAKAKAKEDDVKHVTKADVGVPKVSLDAGGAANTCLVLALPPPSPPPSPNPPPPTLVAATDSGLSTGEIAGVAVGATVGGIVLLVVVGLVLRSLLFKSAKPVFTCLEKAPAEKKASPSV